MSPSERCVHGMDRRFCAVCNKATRDGGAFGLAAAAAEGRGLADILLFLNDERVRATSGAVAAVLGVPPRSIGAMLGDRRPEASWVVNGETGLPADYEQSDWHPALISTGEIISTGNELTLRLTLWRRRRV